MWTALGVAAALAQTGGAASGGGLGPSDAGAVAAAPDPAAAPAASAGAIPAAPEAGSAAGVPSPEPARAASGEAAGSAAAGGSPGVGPAPADAAGSAPSGEPPAGGGAGPEAAPCFERVGLAPFLKVGPEHPRPAPPAPPAPFEPRWLFGAGVLYSRSVTASDIGYGADVSFRAAALPADQLGVGLTLERRLERRWWLTFLVSGGFEESDAPGYGPDASGSVTMRQRRVAASSARFSAGPRYALTEGLPVDVSAVGVVTAAYARTETRWKGGGLATATGSGPDAADASLATVTWNDGAAGVGARLGLALDKTLTEGLGLRLALGLLQADWWSTMDGAASGDRSGAGLGFWPDASFLLTLAL